MAEAIQTSIYKLRPSIAVIDDQGALSSVDIDFDYLEIEFNKHDYQLQQLKTIKKPAHDFRLFYNTWNTAVKWKEFISEIAQPGEPILKNDISVNEGFILLVSIKKRNKTDIYAITGGFGHIELQSYINYQFGLDVLSRLITTDEKVLRSAKERNFIGGVLGSVKYFRGDYNLNENENFGNYYYELRAKLDKSLLKHKFKFTDDELKRDGLCDAKASFTIRKSVTFDKAIEVIDILDSLTKKRPIVDLNLIKRLDKSDNALTLQLDKELTNELFKIFKGSATDVNVEVCHRFFDKYYEAVEFELEFIHRKKRYVEKVSECANLDDVLQLYIMKGLVSSTKSELKSLLQATKITSYDDAGNQLTVGRLSDHFCAELRFNGKSYFIFNQEWYKLKNEFASILNNQCQDLINGHSLSSTFLKKWNSSKESENDFNAKHIGDHDTLVFDKVTPENIEACDILKWNAEEIYFIHVKEGFNNEMRNLGRQVHISARRIIQDLKSGKVFLGKLYDELTNKTAGSSYFVKAQNQLRKYTKSQFLTLFDNRKPIFVVAVLDSSKKGKRSFADIAKYNSNIAKFCLHQLSQEIRLLDTDLKILEVQM